MMKTDKIFFLIILMCFLSTITLSSQLIHLDSTSLAKSKEMIQSGAALKQTLVAYQKLIEDADKLLKSKNASVMDKTIVPPTGDKHDYLSISRYWWPDLEKEDGLPWVRHDGKTNPETQTDAVDRKRLGFMSSGVRKLSLAYYYTHDEKYAKKAISMIETWFLNPDKLMNPHLEFAQSVPGNLNKRATGILDGRSIVRFVPDAISLLSISKHWNDTYQTKMMRWFSDYLVWLTQSDLGIEGSKQKNNHGSWYKFQVASLAYYLGDISLARNTVELAQKSLDDMLDNEGGQTHELARSRSFFYSCFNLQALTNIAVVGEKIGMDMWHYESDHKKSLALAVQYLTPVVFDKEWNHNTLKAIDLSDLVPVISKLSIRNNTTEYNNTLSNILNKIEKQTQSKSMQEFWLLNSMN